MSNSGSDQKDVGPLCFGPTATTEDSASFVVPAHFVFSPGRQTPSVSLGLQVVMCYANGPKAGSHSAAEREELLSLAVRVDGLIRARKETQAEELLKEWGIHVE